MKEYSTEYKDYSKHIALMISTDRLIFNEKSAVRARMMEQARLYKELHIIIFSKKRFDNIKIAENCMVYSTNSISKFYYISNAYKTGKKIIKKIAQNDPILITCQDPFETGLVGNKLVSLRRNSELLLQIHTDMFSPYFADLRLGFKMAFLNKIRLLISKFTLPHADVVRVVSRRIADSLVQKGFKPEEIILKPVPISTEVIKNGIPSFDLHKKFPQFKKIILMISRLEPEKNISMAIEVMSIISDKTSDCGLVIVGSGSELSKLKKQAHKLNLSQKVVFEGWQTDLVSYYKGCDVFLNTSWYEGYGMTLVEAEAAGCRIVSTEVGVAGEMGVEIVDWNVQEMAKIIDFLTTS